jgi:hypothetical protein
MKKFVALAVSVLLFTSVAQAQYLLTIDLSDIENVVITATGENPDADDSGIDGGIGFTMLSFFTSDSDLFAFGSGNLQSNGMTDPFQGAFANSFAAGFGPGVDLTIAFGAGTQNYSTLSSAFSGSMTLDLTAVSALLPAINSTGIIRAGDGSDGSVGGQIGQYQVVPEPSSLLLLAGAALLCLRRRRQVA